MFLTTLIALLPVLATPAPLAQGWPTRDVLLVGTSLPSANNAAPRIARIEDAILATGGGWRAIVVDDTGARHILGAPSLSVPAQLEALPPGWTPLRVDLSLEGNRLELLERQDDPKIRAVFYDGTPVVAVSDPTSATPKSALWTSIQSAHITDDGALLIIGTATAAGSMLPTPTIVLQSVVAPEIHDAYTTGTQPIGDPPASPAAAMNDLGHLVWVCNWRAGNVPTRNPGAGSSLQSIRLMLDSNVLLRSGAPTIWPGSTYELNTAQPVALNHQLEWAITTKIAGPNAKRHAIIKNGQPVLLHGQPVPFLSSATFEAVQLFESAPLFLNDNSQLTWLGQKLGATAIFVDQTCIVETCITTVDGVQLAAIDTDAKGFQATREGAQVLIRGRLADGRAGLFVALKPAL